MSKMKKPVFIPIQVLIAFKKICPAECPSWERIFSTISCITCATIYDIRKLQILNRQPSM